MTPLPNWWPLGEDETFGEERARELVAYIRDKAPPILELARDYLQRAHPNREIKATALSVSRLAKQKGITAQMPRMAIGTLSVGSGGTVRSVDIALTRNGLVAARLSAPTDPVQRWVEG